jgi:hypothetical protein
MIEHIVVAARMKIPVNIVFLDSLEEISRESSEVVRLGETSFVVVIRYANRIIYRMTKQEITSFAYFVNSPGNTFGPSRFPLFYRFNHFNHNAPPIPTCISWNDAT